MVAVNGAVAREKADVKTVTEAQGSSIHGPPCP
jgi:hypothetical protein